jgi:hypothetical protein
MRAPPKTEKNNRINCLESRIVNNFTVNEYTENETNEKRSPQIPVSQLICTIPRGART